MTTTAHNRRFLLIAVAVGAIGLAAFIWWLLQPNSHRFAIDTNVELTEDLALEFTERALELGGNASPGMRPLPYHSENATGDAGQLFARNTLDPESGYVRWRVPRNGRVRDYGVRIEKRGAEIVCTVYRSK